MRLLGTFPQEGDVKLTRIVDDLERFRTRHEGDSLRWYEGIITYDPAVRAYRVAPVPLNLLVRALWWGWTRLREPARRDIISWAYGLGFTDGQAATRRRDLLELLRQWRNEVKDA